MSLRFRQDSLKFFVCKNNWLLRTGIVLGVATTGAAFSLAAPPMNAHDGAHYAQSDFTLPFQVKPGGRCPQNLDLLMSRDGGRSWQVHQTAAPAEGCFRITQAAEGEYWLRVQVRDPAGTALAKSTMHLFVDTTRPRSTMKCDWQNDSKLLLSGTIEDAHLDPQSVQLTIRTDVENKTSMIPVQQSQEPLSGAQFHATTDLPECKSFELRLTAKDRAGNRMVTSERYFHPLLADANDALLPATEDAEFDRTSELPSGSEIAGKDWTAIELGSPKTMSQAHLTSVSASQLVVRKSPNRTATQPEEIIPPARPQELMLDAPVPARSVPAVTQVLSPSRKFKINYELGASISSDQLHVELWVTTNGGSTWEFWGLDRDAQAPAWIEVDGEGDYGLCVVCVNSEADLRFRPMPGDKPDLTVTVQEPPTQRRLEPAMRN